MRSCPWQSDSLEEMTLLRPFLILCALFSAISHFGVAQATVLVEPVYLQGSRPLLVQTEKAAIRDYLQSRQSFRDALDQNRADLLDPEFVGTAKDKIRGTIQRQAALGIHTRYRDRSHDVQIVFYSPEGLSIELTDKGEYDMELLDY
jgi:hypothetical protein